MKPTRICTVVGCERKHAGHGYCAMHLHRWRTSGDPGPAHRVGHHPGEKKPFTPCSVDACEEQHYAQTYCKRHYARVWRTGSLELKPRPSKCDVEGCEKSRNGGGGLCPMHWERLRRNGTTDATVYTCEKCGTGFTTRGGRSVRCSNCRFCDIEGCIQPYRYRGMCESHAHQASARKSRETNLWKVRANDFVRSARVRGYTVTHIVGGRDVRRLYARSNGRCSYCSTSLGRDYHLDHLVPLARGGGTTVGNMALACAGCNLEKRNQLLVEWRLEMQSRHRGLSWLYFAENRRDTP